jgi:hypothetical protein
MEPEHSLLFSTQPAIYPYPETDKFRLLHPILFLYDTCSYYPIFYAYVFHMVSSFKFPHQNPV